MPLYRIDGKLLFFVHIPKTGGTSVEAFLSQSGAQCLFTKGPPDWAMCTPQHLHAAAYGALLPPEFYDYGFAIVRNPFERCLSEYRMRALGTAAEEPAPHFNEWFAEARGRYSIDRYAFDNHLRPQTEFIAEGIEVFRFEDGIATIIERVKTRLGLNMGAFAVHARRSSEEPVEVSREALEEVRAFYADDFERLGYDADIDRFVGAAGGKVTLVADQRVSLKTRLKQDSRVRRARQAVHLARRGIRDR